MAAASTATALQAPPQGASNAVRAADGRTHHARARRWVLHRVLRCTPRRPCGATERLPNMVDESMGRRRWGTLLLVALCHLWIADASCMPQHMQDAALGAHRQLLVKKGLTLPPTVWNTSDLTSFDLNALTRAQVAAPNRPLPAPHRRSFAAMLQELW
jgi:hypothetical protein